MSYYITKTTAKAPIVTFSDGADDVPTKSLVVTIPPTLSGVSSVTETQTGANQWNGQWEIGSINNTTGQDANLGTNRIRSIGYIPVRPNTTYALVNPETVKVYPYFYRSDYTYISVQTTNLSTFTTPSDCYYVRFRSDDNYGDPTGKISINYPSTVTTYEPYQTPTQYTASLGRTIYGGTADIVNGTGTDGYAKDSITSTYLNGLSSSYIGYEASTNYFSGHPTIWVRNWNYQTAKIRQAGGIGCVCNYFPVSMHNTDIINTQNRIYFDVNGKGISDVAGFIAFVQNIETNNESLDIVYELETPTDFTFTGQEVPTRLGYNAFWSDSGDTEVTYYCKVESEELYTVTDTTLKNIADAIRTKTERTAPILVEDMDDEILSIVTGGGGGDAQCDRLFYAQGYDNWQVEIPTIASLIQDEKYAEYVSYDTTTKKFTALKDFTAVIVAWVYTYQTYEASRSDGAFYVNSTKLAQYEANGNAAGSVGGIRLIYNLKQGDTFYPYTPTTDGYPRQYCKVYAVSDIDDDVFTYTNEEAT